MNAKEDVRFLRSLVTELRKLPAEIQWVEFKENNSNPQDIGEYLSALSNAAAMEGKSNAYLVCLLYTSPSPRDRQKSRMPSSA